MNQQRLKAERLVYQIMDILDESGKNTEFWEEEFSHMSDAQFKSYISQNFPFYFQIGAFKETSIDQIFKAAKIIGVPILEEPYLPYKYTNSKGEPLKAKQCMVLYVHMKRMKQLLTKKNGMSIYDKTRDMKTGLLTGVDKNGMESDREFEALAIAGLYNTMKEMARPRADSMTDKTTMNNEIKVKGMVNLAELPEDMDDALSKNLVSAYFLGAQLYTNLVNEQYLLPYTVRNKQKKISRVD